MPSRRDMLVAPHGLFERATWLDETLGRHMLHVPLDAGWAGIARLEAKVFPKPVSEYLDGTFDPTCPECGVETEEGTVERGASSWRVSYGCHAFDMTEEQLLARVRRAGDG